MKPSEVVAPGWMSKLKRDKRGYPIPVSVLVDTDGKPHFTINDEKVRQRLIRADQCHICGRQLMRFRALVGGPLSALHPQGSYIDPCMHVECAQYALKVCPYLAAPNYSSDKRIDDKTLDPKKLPPDTTTILSDPTMNPVRPDLFVLVVHTKSDFLMEGDFIRYVKPRQPYVRMEFWRDGAIMNQSEGLEIAKAELMKQFEKERGETDERPKKRKRVRSK